MKRLTLKSIKIAQDYYFECSANNVIEYSLFRNVLNCTELA